MAVDRQQRSAAVAYRAGTKHGPSFDLKDKSIDEVWLVTCAELFFPLGQDLLGFSEELEEICLWMTDVSNLSKDFRCYLKYDGVMQVELKDSRNSKDPIKEIQTALSSLKWVMTIVPKSEGGLSLMNSSPFVQAVMVYMKDHSPITPEELNYHAELKAASQWSCSDDYEQLVSKKVPDSDCRLKTAVKTTLVTWGKMVNDLQKCDSSNNQLSDYRLAIGVLKNYLEEGKPTCSDKKDVEGILERGTSPGKPPENSPGKNLLVPKGIPLEESQQSPKVFALKGAMAPALHANFMEEHPSAAGTKLLQNGSPRKRKQKANGDENVPVKKVKAAQRRVSPRRKKKPSL